MGEIFCRQSTHVETLNRKVNVGPREVRATIGGREGEREVFIAVCDTMDNNSHYLK